MRAFLRHLPLVAANVAVLAVLATLGCSGKPESDVIPGLMANSIQSHLQTKLGMKFAKPQECSNDGLTWNLLKGEVRDKPTGMLMECDIAYYSSGKVWSVGYTVWHGKSRTPKIALDYLSNCAAIPYSGCDPVKSRRWIEGCAAFKKTSQKTTIGQARLEIIQAPQHMFCLNMESACVPE